ncbi:MAG: hypothetical protein WC346_06735 [Methanogenium sp.]|jgi:uncharacterized Zn finger protein (UPF0148 family)
MVDENDQKTSEERCKICGRLLSEYDPSWSCKKNHHWRKDWAKDKTTKKYKRYLEKRNKSMKEAWRRSLDKLNKKTPPEYASRRGGKVLEELKKMTKKRRYLNVIERDIKI